MPAKPRRTARSKLSVHKAGLRDLDTLVQQRRAMWEALGIRDKEQHLKGDQVYKRWARARLKNHELMAWIVKSSDGRVAGGGSVWLSRVQPRPHRAGMVQPYLLSMYTEPDFRRRGVASMVVKEAIELCRKNKYERLMLHASEMGRKVYSKLGFKRTWEMRLDLAHR
jgi:GNAT superfamily N-acetyltransferase